MDENNKLPFGWGDTEDEEDYSFPEEGADSPWGAASSSDESSESDEVHMPDDMIPDDKVDVTVPQQNIPAKKSLYAPMIIGIAVVVIVAGVGGVFGGILLTKDRETPVSSETDHVSMETATEMMQPDTQAETQSTAELPYKVYEEAAIRTLDGFLESYWLGSADAPYYLDSVMYSLIDLNEDGVPELLMSYPTEASDSSSLYIYDSGNYREYDALTWGNARVCVSAHQIELRSYEGAEVRTIYEMDAQGNISLKDVIFYDHDGIFMCNGEKISSGEYDALQRSYDSLQWENIARYERKRSGAGRYEIIETMENSVQTETIPLTESPVIPEVETMDPLSLSSYEGYIEVVEYLLEIIAADMDEFDCINAGVSVYYSDLYANAAGATNVGYALYDLNTDTIPELFITVGGSIIVSTMKMRFCFASPIHNFLIRLIQQVLCILTRLIIIRSIH